MVRGVAGAVRDALGDPLDRQRLSGRDDDHVCVEDVRDAGRLFVGHAVEHAHHLDALPGGELEGRLVLLSRRRPGERVDEDVGALEVVRRRRPPGEVAHRLGVRALGESGMDPRRELGFAADE